VKRTGVKRTRTGNGAFHAPYDSLLKVSAVRVVRGLEADSFWVKVGRLQIAKCKMQNAKCKLSRMHGMDEQQAMDENPYAAPQRVPSKLPPPVPELNERSDGSRWFTGILGAILLAWGPLAFFDSLDPIMEPHRFHGFEVSISRFFVWAGPLVAAGGIALLWRAVSRR
jgi:hypothetical protein